MSRPSHVVASPECSAPRERCVSARFELPSAGSIGTYHWTHGVSATREALRRRKGGVVAFLREVGLERLGGEQARQL